MRVLFDGQIFVHQVSGGISRYYVNLASGLAQIEGCSARIIAPLHRNQHLRAEGSALGMGFGIPSSRLTNRLCLAATRALSPVFAGQCEFDLVHETYYSQKPLIGRGLRRVTTVYDMVHEITGRNHPTSADKRASIARCDHVLCISHNTKKDLIELFGVAPERATTVHLGYTDFSRIDGAELPVKLAGVPYVLFVGQRAGYKNFSNLLKAVAADGALKRDLKILCFGGGPLEASELALAVELGLDKDRVVQIGGPDALLASAYRGALAMVYPSYYEGFGLPCLEAMSAGCPVLCSNTSSLPEVVGEAALMFDPKSVDEIRAAIIKVSSSSAVRDELVSRGHLQRAQFSWDKCVRKTLAVYQAVS
jgi:glycosyltransferase involved in cell wall biosynthesis